MVRDDAPRTSLNASLPSGLLPLVPNRSEFPFLLWSVLVAAAGVARTSPLRTPCPTRSAATTTLPGPPIHLAANDFLRRFDSSPLCSPAHKGPRFSLRSVRLRHVPLPLRSLSAVPDTSTDCAGPGHATRRHKASSHHILAKRLSKVPPSGRAPRETSAPLPEADDAPGPVRPPRPLKPTAVCAFPAARALAWVCRPAGPVPSRGTGGRQAGRPAAPKRHRRPTA